MDNSDICAVVVCYNPDSDVVGNIATYGTHVHTLYLIDNSQPQQALDVASLPGNVRILSHGKNIGIAAALNLALKQAEADGYRWLLTMDQDTSFEAGQLERLFKCRRYLSADKLLLVSPRHTPLKWLPEDECRFESTEVVMTSGNLVFIPHAVAIGGYDERLFIDEVDHEFCLRGHMAGYAPMLLSSVCVDHRLGVLKEYRGKAIRLYTSERIYYMIRNYLYIRQKYRQSFPDFFRKRSRHLLKFFLSHMLYSDQKLSVVSKFLKGWYDYHAKRFGPIGKIR